MVLYMVENSEAAPNFGIKINEHSDDGIICGRECDIVQLPQIPDHIPE